MKKFKMSLKINLPLVGIIVICLTIVFLNLKYILAKKYAVDVSPDGNYKMIIYQFPAISAGFPGQGGAGGSPGYLVVRDTNTNLKIASEETYMLDAAYPIIWTPEKVTAGKFIAIELPDTYHEAPENRQYFIQKIFLKAVEEGDINLVKDLLKQGAVLDENVLRIKNPVYLAASNGNFEMVAFLLSQNDYLQRLNQVKNGILSGQSILQNPSMTTFLIQKGLKPEGRGYGLPPLHASIWLQTFETFKILVENDATIDLEDPNVQEDFQRASPEFQKKVLELLKERKVEKRSDL